MSTLVQSSEPAGTVEPVEPARRPPGVRPAGLLLAVGVLGAVVVLSIAIGSRNISPSDSWRLFWSPDGSTESVIIHDLRIPRTAIGLLVGAALGVSGALMQALTRNPLAEPGLLGVNLGASTAVVIAIAFFGVGSLDGYVWFAFAGAGVTSVAVFVLGSTGRSPTPERQVLAGVAITAVLGAFLYGMLVTRRETFNQYRFWDVGSLSGRGPEIGWQVLPFVVVGMVIAFSLGPSLNALALGEETGKALGASVARTRTLGMLSITLLCGAATAAAGPIWFVGLAVPLVARMICGPDQRWILPFSAVLAPVLLLGADVVGRVIVAPSEMQVGIITAFVGAPVFMALARRRRIGTL